MQRYLLDTNICIYITKKRPPEVQQYFARLNSTQVFISSITVFELAYGVENSPVETQAGNKRALTYFLQPLNIIDFSTQDAYHTAQIRADLKRKGTPIGAYDLQIAATALTHDLTLVTNNTKEFERIPHLKLENWLG